MTRDRARPTAERELVITLYTAAEAREAFGQADDGAADADAAAAAGARAARDAARAARDAGDAAGFEDARLAAWADGAARARAELLPWAESNHECCVLTPARARAAGAPAMHVLALKPPRLWRTMHPSLRALLERNGVNIGGDLDLRAARCADMLAALTDVTRSERDAAKRLGRSAPRAPARSRALSRALALSRSRSPTRPRERDT